MCVVCFLLSLTLSKYTTTKQTNKHINRRSLLPNGIILIKENVSKSGFLVDKDDSSLTRTPDHYQHLIKAGGGTVLREGVQQKFPEELFKVFMYAVR